MDVVAVIEARCLAMSNNRIDEVCTDRRPAENHGVDRRPIFGYPVIKESYVLRSVYHLDTGVLQRRRVGNVMPEVLRPKLHRVSTPGKKHEQLIHGLGSGIPVRLR